MLAWRQRQRKNQHRPDLCRRLLLRPAQRITCSSGKRQMRTMHTNWKRRRNVRRWRMRLVTSSQRSVHNSILARERWRNPSPNQKCRPSTKKSSTTRNVRRSMRVSRMQLAKCINGCWTRRLRNHRKSRSMWRKRDKWINRNRRPNVWYNGRRRKVSRPQIWMRKLSCRWCTSRRSNLVWNCPRIRLWKRKWLVFRWARPPNCNAANVDLVLISRDKALQLAKVVGRLCWYDQKVRTKWTDCHSIWCPAQVIRKIDSSWCHRKSQITKRLIPAETQALTWNRWPNRNQ